MLTVCATVTESSWLTNPSTHCIHSIMMLAIYWSTVCCVSFCCTGL